MALTDIDISETLETSAPSIKYTGNEGPKSPEEQRQMAFDDTPRFELQSLDELLQEFRLGNNGQEPTSINDLRRYFYNKYGPEGIAKVEKAIQQSQQAKQAQEPQRMASAGDPMLQEEYDKYVYAMQEQGQQPVSFEQFVQEIMSGMAQGGRVPAAYGGIMGLGGRRRYAFGSIKDRIRKIIPNEAADIAVKAAPFVAPFNPIAGGLMAGIGGFDQHGSISKGLKSGLMNYGMGQLGRQVGGAEMQTGWQNPFSKASWSSPYVAGEDIFSKTKERFFPGTAEVATSGNTLGKKAPIVEDYDMEWTDVINKGEGGGSANPLHNFLKGIGMNTAAMAGIVGASALAGLYTAKNPADDSIEQMRGEGLDLEGIRTEVQEAFKDPTGKALEEIRIKYPFLGARETKNLDLMADGGRIGYKHGNLAGILKRIIERREKKRLLGEERELRPTGLGAAQGGRIGAQEGGLMDLGGMEKDYRNDGGFVPLGGEERADDVPARLSKNEFVFTADAVRGAGGGDIDKGAGIMENVMKNLEQGGRISEESQGLSGAQEMFDVSERLSEVV